MRKAMCVSGLLLVPLFLIVLGCGAGVETLTGMSRSVMNTITGTPGAVEDPNIESNYSCYRHIYNYSSSPWVVAIADMSMVLDIPIPKRIGNVYFGDGSLPYCTQQNGPCLVPPGATIEMKFTYSGSTTAGLLVIIDKNERKGLFTYRGYANRPPYIEHRGSTGAVTLNDPANGDIKMEGNQW